MRKALLLFSLERILVQSYSRNNRRRNGISMKWMRGRSTLDLLNIEDFFWRIDVMICIDVLFSKNVGVKTTKLYQKTKLWRDWEYLPNSLHMNATCQKRAELSQAATAVIFTVNGVEELMAVTTSAFNRRAAIKNERGHKWLPFSQKTQTHITKTCSVKFLFSCFCRSQPAQHLPSTHEVRPPPSSVPLTVSRHLLHLVSCVFHLIRAVRKMALKQSDSSSPESGFHRTNPSPNMRQKKGKRFLSYFSLYLTVRWWVRSDLSSLHEGLFFIVAFLNMKIIQRKITV